MTAGEIRVVVVGAGVVGACVAFRLVQAGARVTVVDAQTPASGASGATFAWVNASAKRPKEYFELNRAGVAEHPRLAEELADGSWLHPTGTVCWTADESAAERVAECNAAGYTTELLDAAGVRAREPSLSVPEDMVAALFPQEGWVDVPRLVELLLRRCVDRGAVVRAGVAVEAVQVSGDRVTGVGLAGGTSLAADVVVNCAGAAADRVAASAGVPLPLRRGTEALLVTVAAPGDPVRGVVWSPTVHARPDGRGRVALGDALASRRLAEGGDAEELAAGTAARAAALVPALAGAPVLDVRARARPIPADGFSCVGALRGLAGYVEAVTHSGVTLGPLLGRLVAQIVMGGHADPLLDAYRPDRFPGRA
ncbi:MAG: FAD-binding oxidoreductase [Actinobacteria bacterium]|nr:FAD-binding oxidoreductase [Actinomycetota bacterium]